MTEALSGDLSPEYGVRHRAPSGKTYDAPVTNQAAAIAHVAACSGEGWSHPAVAVVRRGVTGWEEVGHG